MVKYVYFFGGGKADGRTDMKELLGGKACFSPKFPKGYDTMSSGRCCSCAEAG